MSTTQGGAQQLLYLWMTNFMGSLMLGFHAAEGWNLLGGSRMDWKEELLNWDKNQNWETSTIRRWLVARSCGKYLCMPAGHKWRDSVWSVSISSSQKCYCFIGCIWHLQTLPPRMHTLKYIDTLECMSHNSDLRKDIQLWHSNRYVFSRKSHVILS